MRLDTDMCVFLCVYALYVLGSMSKWLLSYDRGFQKVPYYVGIT